MQVLPCNLDASSYYPLLVFSFPTTSAVDFSGHLMQPWSFDKQIYVGWQYLCHPQEVKDNLLAQISMAGLISGSENPNLVY